MIVKTTGPKSDTAIHVRGLSKAYTIKKGLENQSTLTEQALERIKNPFHRAKKETFWALKDIDLDIKKGEVVGIIGRNGAGKSTLLKVLSRITAPTTGQVDLYGRVGSLLEVGTGFHPELTGRENIYLNGAVLGMTRPEIRSQFDAIVDFAGVEKFLDTPVKRYSSGMYVRLAFAVAAHLRTEILIVDEVLAVGDVEFQKKCLGKMKDVAAGEGRTVLFVSHNLAAVESLCDSGVVLESGRTIFTGSSTAAVNHYHAYGKATRGWYKATNIGRKPSCIVEAFLSHDGSPLSSDMLAGELVEISVRCQTIQDLRFARLGIGIDSLNGERIASFHSRHVRGADGRDIPAGQFTFSCCGSDLRLAPGDYAVKIALETEHGHADVLDPGFTFTVSDADFYETGGSRIVERRGLVLSRQTWSFDRSPGTFIADSGIYAST